MTFSLLFHFPFYFFFLFVPPFSILFAQLSSKTKKYLQDP
jgi:hypothetical protein